MNCIIWSIILWCVASVTIPLASEAIRLALGVET